MCFYVRINVRKWKGVFYCCTLDIEREREREREKVFEKDRDRNSWSTSSSSLHLRIHCHNVSELHRQKKPVSK